MPQHIYPLGHSRASYPVDGRRGSVTTLRLALVTSTPPQDGEGAGMDDQEINRHITHITLEGLAAGTIYGRRQCLIRLADYLGTPLAEATADDLLGWRAALQHLSAGTIYNYCGHAREFYRWAALRGLLPRGEDPAEGLPVPKRPQRIPRPISEPDLMEVVAAAPRRIRLWLDLAAWCGLRACEIGRASCRERVYHPV